MKKIYTRTGDGGLTRIHGGKQVSKTDIRIEANGWLDALNVEIGALRTILSDDEDRSFLLEMQNRLMTAMSIVATPSCCRAANPRSLPEDNISKIESHIDNILATLEPSHFIIPGGGEQAVAAHRARVTARTAERRLWQLNAVDPVPPLILTFVNRLSDLLFVMARKYSSE